MFLAESRERSSMDGMSYGSLIDYENQRIKRTVISTTVAELYYFMKCFVSCKFLRGLWMDLSGEIADIHMGNHSKNNSLTRTKGDNSHDLHVEKGSLFRKYS